MTMRSGMSSRVLGALVAGSLAVAGVASCAAFPAGPAPVAEAGTASLTVRPSFDGFGVQSTDVAPFAPGQVTKLELKLYTVVGNAETAVKTAANVHVTVTRTSGYTAPVTFNHLRYGNTYRIRAVAYRTVGSQYEVISTTDSGSYVDVVVTADTASLSQTHALKVKLADRGLSARFSGPEAFLQAASAQAGAARTAPVIAHNDEDNQYLLVWVDARSAGDVYGQRLEADGRLIGGEFLIAQGAASQDQPAVVYSALHDCFYVVWRDNRVIGYTGIYGQKVTRAHVASGSNLSGSDILIGGALLSACHSPTLVAGKQALGGAAPFAVAWKNDTTGAIEATALDASGAPVGLPLNRPSGSAFFHSPALAQDPTSGRFLLAYASQVNGNHTVVGHFLAANVTSLTPGFPMGISGLSKSAPAVAHNGQAMSFLVAWREDSGAGATIQACLLSETGTPPVSAVVPVSVGASAPGTPTLTFNGTTGEHLVAWVDRRSGFARVYGQRLSGAGAPIGGNFALSSVASADTRPAVAYNPVANQAFVVWQAAGVYTSDLFGRLLDYFARPLLPGEVTPQ